jgi:hypothetical protein
VAFAGHPASIAVALWVAAAIGLSAVTGRVSDWYDMTDELVYERLAISVARSGSLLPRINGSFVRSLDQLYPWLIAPLFRRGSVPADLHNAHLLGAWVMSSACIPAFLLARRVTGKATVGLLIAVLSLTLPWMIYSAFLLSEVVAYPVFLWTLLAIQAAAVRPSMRNDLLTLVALALAFLARSEFVCLLAVPPPVLFARAFAAGRGRPPARARRALRRLVRDNTLLVSVYVAIVLAAVGYAAGGGRLLDLSIYGQQINGPTVPPGFAAGLAGSLAQVALSVGLLPFIIAFGWLLSQLVRPSASSEQQVFAWLGAVTTGVITLEVTRFDLGVGPYLFDRYLFYLVPVVLIAFVCALSDRSLRRSSLLPGLLIVCAGFTFAFQAAFTWSDPAGRVDPDTPISILYGPIVAATGSREGAQVALVTAAIALTVMFLVTTRTARSRARVSVLLLAALVLGLPLETGYVFTRVLGHDSYSGRPLTGAASATAGLGWVDAAVGTQANVTMIPYTVSTSYFVTLNYWRDLEFWNKSVDRDAEYPSTGLYAFTGVWFPKLGLQFNPATGAVNRSPSPYVVQSINESRFQIAGNVQAQTGQAMLIDAVEPWHLAWLSFGLSDDGWLQPHRSARIRVYSSTGQHGSRIHFLSIQVWAPSGVVHRPFVVGSDLVSRREFVSDTGTTFVNTLPVCVPARGYSDVTVKASGESTIPGDMSSLSSSLGTRTGSVYLADISVSKTVGGRCSARP